MNKQLPVWKLIADSMQQNIPVMLLYVLESRGSSPGRQGFFMAVNREQDMEGSIGGGIMEHKFVEMAKERLRTGERDPEIRKQFHDKTAAKNQSGMICSGEQTVLIRSLRREELDPVLRIIDTLQQNGSGTLVLSPEGLSFSAATPKKDFHFKMISEEDWRYEEKIGYKNDLFIIGGGHCALALSRLMSRMDFYIRVYEERKELKTFLQNEFVHEKILIENYSQLNSLVPPGAHHYVVLMTFGYRTDDIALRALLHKDFKYLGMLGSRAKIKKLFEDYRKEGIEESRLQRVNAPIGIPVGSQTPEEIAVSIAAEIIRVKNQ